MDVEQLGLPSKNYNIIQRTLLIAGHGTFYGVDLSRQSGIENVELARQLQHTCGHRGISFGVYQDIRVSSLEGSGLRTRKRHRRLLKAYHLLGQSPFPYGLPISPFVLPENIIGEIKVLHT